MTSDARNSQMPSLPLVSPVSGRASTVYGIFMALCALRLELGREILHRAGHAVLIRSAVHDRFGEEVAMSGRRRRRPLERRRFPRIAVDERSPLDARKEVDDERDLKE